MHCVPANDVIGILLLKCCADLSTGVQGVPQSQTVANPRNQEKEKYDKN